MKFFFATILFLCTTAIQFALAQNSSDLDVHNYHVELTIDIQSKHIEGNVHIDFSINPSSNKVIFNCGALKVSAVTGNEVQRFLQEGEDLIIFLSKTDNKEYQVQIAYSGSPLKGMVFLPEQVYSVYATNEWMVCNTSPGDRASITLDLIFPNTLSCIANGQLIQQKKKKNNLVRQTWTQQQQSPTYTYGFAIGIFNEFKEQHNHTSLNYYSAHYNSKELETIFDKTADMLSFFEEKSGTPYFQNSYSQILIGNHYQEMSGFAVLKKIYGDLVLKDSTETNLISHELAHQWWGNRITCQSWNHFWLNEGLATFMSAAYNEHRFGEKKYLADIESYLTVYEKIKSRGNDKPLVFKNWSNPSQDDRNLVYFKGAYVLHLLRMELGDEAFWKAIKSFSITYEGKSVTTENLQASLEESTGKDLDVFFNEWMY